VGDHKPPRWFGFNNCQFIIAVLDFDRVQKRTSGLLWHSPTFLIVLKLLLAIVCGGAIGFERELSRKPAGLRTNVLICMGAALFMVVSRHISGGQPYTDPARLVAQVVAGIGFLGAGVILQSRGSVTGLTTAATIFVVAAVGIAIGEGMFTIAGLATVLIISVLVLLRRVERVFVRRKKLFQYSLRVKDSGEFLEQLVELLQKEKLQLDDFEVEHRPDGGHAVRFKLVTSLETNRHMLKKLNQMGKELRTSTHEEAE
jgi:putative Mg2+ transporter-C (MgtC) family protein